MRGRGPWGEIMVSVEQPPEQELSIVVSTRTFLPIVGGAELGIHEIYHRIGRRHNVTIITPAVAERWARTAGADGYTSPNYMVRRLMPGIDPAGRSVLGRALKRTGIPYLLMILRLRREQDVDVINAHFIAPHLLVLLVTRYVLRIPGVLSLVGRTDVVASLGFLRKSYAHATLSAAKKAVLISRYCLECEERSHETMVIPYGVDTATFSPERRSDARREMLGVRPHDVMLLCVQRLDRTKRVDVLIRVLALVLPRQPDITLVVVGKGQEAEPLRRLAHDLGVASSVRFVGYVGEADLPEYFASADLFVFHSLIETFGIVFVQAMASGLPIVAARTSCVPEVVGDGGILVDAFDIEAFARAIEALIADAGERTEIGQRNRKRALSEFDWDVVAERYECELLRLARIEPQPPGLSRWGSARRGARGTPQPHLD